jgi:hypothetical protein
MMIIKNIIILFVLLFFTAGIADVSVKIIHLEGSVKIRYGLDENWKTASIGVSLKSMDTILSGENSRVVLQFENGNMFTLGSNSVIDISDLRKIYEKELFLYLMSKKVDQIETQGEKTPLRVGNVSVVHGESKVDSDSSSDEQLKSTWAEWEINGALSLYNQQYYPNTVVKLHKVLEKYDSYEDCGKIFFYIARSLEQLEMGGQAIDAYKSVIDAYFKQKCDDKESQARVEESRIAINNLKNE